MPNLVAVPYAPQYKGTPRAVARLLRACQIAGHNIPLTDGWRSFASQAYYWDQYINHHGAPASNPYTGQRNHMRGEAFDIENPSQDGPAMAAAGFVRDAVESWHYNDPDWSSMPIIYDDDSGNTTVSGGAPAQIVEDYDNMKLYWEFFKIVGDKSGSIYVSWMRTGYWGLSGKSFNDYVYYFAHTLGIPIPTVQSVENPQAFGPKLG